MEFTLYKKELKRVRTLMQVFADSPEKADYLIHRLSAFEREFHLSSYEVRKLPSPITDAYYVLCLTELGKFDKYFGLYTEEESAFLEEAEKLEKLHPSPQPASGPGSPLLASVQQFLKPRRKWREDP